MDGQVSERRFHARRRRLIGPNTGRRGLQLDQQN